MTGPQVAVLDRLRCKQLRSMKVSCRIHLTKLEQMWCGPLVEHRVALTHCDRSEVILNLSTVNKNRLVLLRAEVRWME